MPASGHLFNTLDTYDARNLALITAGSDKSFGAWISYLHTFAIPWVIVCDGPVLSPEREVSLFNQLIDAKFDLGPVPDTSAPFADWKECWVRNGVFTVADQFGGVKNERDKRGEIEAFFARMDQERWKETCQRYPKSKVRAGYAFAEETNLANHRDQLRELQKLWKAILTAYIRRQRSQEQLRRQQERSTTSRTSDSL